MGGELRPASQVGSCARFRAARRWRGEPLPCQLSAQLLYGAVSLFWLNFPAKLLTVALISVEVPWEGGRGGVVVLCGQPAGSCGEALPKYESAAAVPPVQDWLPKTGPRALLRRASVAPLMTAAGRREGYEAVAEMGHFLRGCRSPGPGGFDRGANIWGQIYIK